MTCARCATLIRERDEAREDEVILRDALRVARADLVNIFGVLDYPDSDDSIRLIDAALTATRRG